MAKKYYAVKNGRDGVSGVYLTWEDCKSQIQGAPGVAYKSFPTLEEAEAFLNGKEPGPGKPKGTKKPKKEEAPPEPPYEENMAIAYTDGSYRKDTREFSAGAVLFYDHKRVDFSQKNGDAAMAEMHNVAGEIMAAVLVIRYCLEQGIPALTIYHDYSGVGQWAMGAWKATKPGTQAYSAFCQKAAQKIKLSFVLVRGHSGDYWNDQADRLAKRALGLEGV